MHLFSHNRRGCRSSGRLSGQREPALRLRGRFERAIGVRRPGMGLCRSLVFRENGSSWFVHYIFFPPQSPHVILWAGFLDPRTQSVSNTCPDTDTIRSYGDVPGALTPEHPDLAAGVYRMTLRHLFRILNGLHLCIRWLILTFIYQLGMDSVPGESVSPGRLVTCRAQATGIPTITPHLEISALNRSDV